MFLLSPQVELKFPAPSKTGNHQDSVIMRSDPYLGLDQGKPLKVGVWDSRPTNPQFVYVPPKGDTVL